MTDSVSWDEVMRQVEEAVESEYDDQDSAEITNFQNQNTLTDIKQFPDLFNFLNKNFNLSQTTEYVYVDREGKLCKRLHDFMFHSYNIFEYGLPTSKAFYEDFGRSFPENRCQHSNQSTMTFEQFGNAVLNKVKSKIVKNHCEECWRFLRIIFDHPRRTSVSIAALCINQVFGHKIETSMRKYNNTIKTKSTLQLFRKEFSLASDRHKKHISERNKKKEKRKC